MPTRNSGFNLVEIMISLAIIGVMMALAAPNLRDFMRNARITSLTNDLMADLQLARTEAVKNSRRTWFCPSDSEATLGHCNGGVWTTQYRAIIVDSNESNSCDAGDVVVRHKKSEATTGSPTVALVNGDATFGVTFLPSGILPGSATMQFNVCDSRNGPNGVSSAPFLHRRVSIAPSGRANVVQINCQ
jgi:type IV fimbrial biogenesis protein FimT